MSGLWSLYTPKIRYWSAKAKTDSITDFVVYACSTKFDMHSYERPHQHLHHPFAVHR